MEKSGGTPSASESMRTCWNTSTRCSSSHKLRVRICRTHSDPECLDILRPQHYALTPPDGVSATTWTVARGKYATTAHEVYRHTTCQERHDPHSPTSNNPVPAFAYLRALRIRPNPPHLGHPFPAPVSLGPFPLVGVFAGCWRLAEAFQDEWGDEWGDNTLLYFLPLSARAPGLK